MQLRSEYEIDKQQALDRVASESEQSIMHMRNSIEQAYEHQRDELTRRLEREQKDRLAAVKRLQWVSIVLSIVKKRVVEVSVDTVFLTVFMLDAAIFDYLVIWPSGNVLVLISEVTLH